MYPSAETREHGDAILRTLGAEAVDFSVNLNPYGPCDAVREAARAADLRSYPDSSATAARRAWAEQLGCDPDELVFAHGAAELLWQAMRLLLRPGDRCALFTPTFSEARAAAQAAGARVIRLESHADDEFRHDLHDYIAALSDVRVAYLCTPNNPTGQHVPAPAVDTLARRCPETHFVLDQSFLALSDHAHELTHSYPDNVLCLRSLTKEHALAGLRLGYARGSRALVRALETQRAPWSTSAPAQAAALAAAHHSAFVDESWQRMRKDRDQLASGLRVLGLLPVPSATSFQLVPIANASQLSERLQRHAIAVRDGTSFGLPDHIRLAARPAADRERLLRALAQELA